MQTVAKSSDMIEDVLFRRSDGGLGESLTDYPPFAAVLILVDAVVRVEDLWKVGVRGVATRFAGVAALAIDGW